MSLAIDVDRVERVMIGNEWFTVVENTFDTDAYEFMHQGVRIFNGSGMNCATGYRFQTDTMAGPKTNIWMSGPISAIQAVEYAAPRVKKER